MTELSQSNSEPRYRKFLLRGHYLHGTGRDRYTELPVFSPHLGEGEQVVALDAGDVIRTLEDVYHAQNPSTVHPADVITKRFKLDGHEGLADL